MSRSLIPLLVLLVGLSCLVEARFLPDKPHRTYVRRRPSPTDPDLEIIEVRKVYYERRPKKKVLAPLDEDELDWRIRCDFDPSLMECRGVAPVSSTRPPTTTTTTTSTSTTTTSTTTTTPRPSTTSTTVAPLDEESWDCNSDPTQEKCKYIPEHGLLTGDSRTCRCPLDLIQLHHYRFRHTACAARGRDARGGGGRR